MATKLKRVVGSTDVTPFIREAQKAQSLYDVCRMERVTFRHHARGVGKAIISLRHLHSSPFTCHPIPSAPRTAGWHCIHEWPQNTINWITWGSICHWCVCQIARALCLLALWERALVWLSECWHRLIVSCFCLVNSSFYKYTSQARAARDKIMSVMMLRTQKITQRTPATLGFLL